MRKELKHSSNPLESHKPNTMLHIFNHTIKPILLCGSEIWCYFPPKNHKDTDQYTITETDALIIEKHTYKVL